MKTLVRPTADLEEALHHTGLDFTFQSKALRYRFGNKERSVERWAVLAKETGHLFGTSALRKAPPLPKDVFDGTEPLSAAGFRYVSGGMVDGEIRLVQRLKRERWLLHRYWPTDAMATTMVLWAAEGIPVVAMNLKKVISTETVAPIWKWYQTQEVTMQIMKTKAIRENFPHFIERRVLVDLQPHEDLRTCHDVLCRAAERLVEQEGHWSDDKMRHAMSVLWALLNAYT